MGDSDKNMFCYLPMCHTETIKLIINRLYADNNFSAVPFE